MQAGLQFFEMPIKGLGAGGTQKIGIKIPGQQSEKTMADDGGFAEVMDALMALTPEQLQASLNQLEWVPVEGDVELFAPVIDMSDLDKGSQGLSKILMNETGASASLLPIDSSIAALSRPVGRTAEMLPQNPVSTGGPENYDDLINVKGADEKTLHVHTPIILNNKDDVIASGVPHREERAHLTPAEFKAGAGFGDAQNANEGGKTPKAFNTSITSAVPTEVKNAETVVATGTVKMADPIKGADVGKIPALEPHRTIVEPKAEPHQKGARLVQPDVQSKSASIDNQLKSDAPHPEPLDDAKLNQAAVAKKSNPVSDALPNSNDKMMNAAHQIKETPIKEIGRQAVQSVPAKEHMGQAAEKATKVQPNTSAKDAALSFASRWTAMTDNNPEAIAESKTATGTSEKTDSNEVIRQIVQRMTLKTSRLQSQMNIKLRPEFLGNVRMQITTDNQQVAVRMIAESSAVKEMIEQNMQVLKAELQQHGLEIDKFDVLVGKDSDENRHGQQHANWQRRAPQKERAFSEDGSGNHNSSKDETEKQQLRATRSSNDNEIDYFA